MSIRKVATHHFSQSREYCEHTCHIKTSDFIVIIWHARTFDQILYFNTPALSYAWIDLSQIEWTATLKINFHQDIKSTWIQIIQFIKTYLFLSRRLQVYKRPSSSFTHLLVIFHNLCCHNVWTNGIDLRNNTLFFALFKYAVP